MGLILYRCSSKCELVNSPQFESVCAEVCNFRFFLVPSYPPQKATHNTLTCTVNCEHLMRKKEVAINFALRSINWASYCVKSSRRNSVMAGSLVKPNFLRTVGSSYFAYNRAATSWIVWNSFAPAVTKQKRPSSSFSVIR